MKQLLVSDCGDVCSNWLYNNWFFREKRRIRRDAKPNQKTSTQPVQLSKRDVTVCIVVVNKKKVGKYLKQKQIWTKNKSDRKRSWFDIWNQFHTNQHVASPRFRLTTGNTTREGVSWARWTSNRAHIAWVRRDENKATPRNVLSGRLKSIWLRIFVIRE